MSGSIVVEGRAAIARIVRKLMDDYEAGLCEWPRLESVPHVGAEAVRVSMTYYGAAPDVGGIIVDPADEEATKP